MESIKSHFKTEVNMHLYDWLKKSIKKNLKQELFFFPSLYNRFFKLNFPLNFWLKFFTLHCNLHHININMYQPEIRSFQILLGSLLPIQGLKNPLKNKKFILMRQKLYFLALKNDFIYNEMLEYKMVHLSLWNDDKEALGPYYKNFQIISHIAGKLLQLMSQNYSQNLDEQTDQYNLGRYLMLFFISQNLKPQNLIKTQKLFLNKIYFAEQYVQILLKLEPKHFNFYIYLINNEQKKWY